MHTISGGYDDDMMMAQTNVNNRAGNKTKNKKIHVTECAIQCNGEKPKPRTHVVQEKKRKKKRKKSTDPM